MHARFAWMLLKPLILFGSALVTLGAMTGCGGSEPNASGSGGETTAGTGSSSSSGGLPLPELTKLATFSDPAQIVHSVGCSDTSAFIAVGTSILSVPLTGGEPTVLDTSKGMGHLVVDGSSVFFEAREEFREVRRWDEGVGIVASNALNFPFAGLAVTANNVYVSIVYGNTMSWVQVFEHAKELGTPVSYHQVSQDGVPDVAHLTAVGNSIAFVVRETEIWSASTMPLSSFTMTTFETKSITGLAADGDELFVGMRTGNQDTYGIHQTTAGSATTKLLVSASMSSPSKTGSVMVDNQYIYYVDFDLYRASRDGGGSNTLALYGAVGGSFEHVAQCAGHIVFSVQTGTEQTVYAIMK